MKVTALAGGVGGAKLVQGLAQILLPNDLTIIANTGDDFEHFGLYICPDLDTICYTLAGKVNPNTGWGVAEESYRVLDNVQVLKGPTWFKLGDKDLATHLMRTKMLKTGKSLTEITGFLCDLWEINHPVLPATNDPVRTFIETEEEGVLPFQEYFVKFHFNLHVKNIFIKGLECAKPTPEVIHSLEVADAIIICPSNPFVSIDPIINLKGVKEILEKKFVTAVSPLVGGHAIKGPLTRMMDGLKIGASNASIADHYRELVNCIFIDKQDQKQVPSMTHSSIIFKATDIMLPNLERRIDLAAEIVGFLKEKL